MGELYTNGLLCGISIPMTYYAVSHMVPKVSGFGKFGIGKKKVAFWYLQKYSLEPLISSINFAVNFKCKIIITDPLQKKKYGEHIVILVFSSSRAFDFVRFNEIDTYNYVDSILYEIKNLGCCHYDQNCRNLVKTC